MPMHNQPDPGHDPEHEVDASAGFERTDASVTGIAVFLVSLLIFVGVIGLLCYGIGAWFNAHMNREDGPNSKWTKTVDVRQLGNMPSSPELQNKVAEITQTFPTPRLLTDDGDQDVANMHAREDLLLDNYTWVDQSKGTVRIPIEQAMQLIAQRGLKAAPAITTQAPMTGDVVPTVPVPLTDGFARTSFEQDEAEAEAKRAGSSQ
ncbi:MAG TPA: hypothetical protein VMT38_02620 [Terracidiphilus sp.]|nr:hypothetical protein [Terracidiphilus sp.]